jgi:hypothetical protein
VAQSGRGRPAAQRGQDRTISPAGRVAACVTLGCILASVVIFLVAAWPVFVCTRGCHANPAVGGMVFLLTLVAGGVSIQLGYQVLRRPVDPTGAAGWAYGLGFIFVVGMIAGIAAIPDLTCPAGYHLSYSGYCSGSHDTHLDPASWIWLKDLTLVLGLALAATVIPMRRLRLVAAPVAVVVWFAGTLAFLGKLL